MGQQSLAALRMRRILIGGEDDVAAGGIRQRLDRLGGGCRFGIGVDSDLAEVMAEAGLHEGADGGVERLAGGAQRIVDDRRRRGLFRAARFDPLRLQWFRLTLGTARPASAGALELRRRGAHHPFGDAVGFLFVEVSGGADR